MLPKKSLSKVLNTDGFSRFETCPAPWTKAIFASGIKLAHSRIFSGGVNMQGRR